MKQSLSARRVRRWTEVTMDGSDDGRTSLYLSISLSLYRRTLSSSRFHPMPSESRAIRYRRPNATALSFFMKWMRSIDRSIDRAMIDGWLVIRPAGLVRTERFTNGHFVRRNKDFCVCGVARVVQKKKECMHTRTEKKKKGDDATRSIDRRVHDAFSKKKFNSRYTQF